MIHVCVDNQYGLNISRCTCPKNCLEVFEMKSASPVLMAGHTLSFSMAYEAYFLWFEVLDSYEA